MVTLTIQAAKAAESFGERTLMVGNLNRGCRRDLMAKNHPNSRIGPLNSNFVLSTNVR
jgi:hypothetical protein